jgi:hypothetical protein
MKRKSLVSILGAAASLVGVATSYGQGSVFFSTYVGTVYQPIRYTATFGGGTVGPGFTAELFYGLGAGLPFSALSPVPGGTAAVGTQVPGYVTDGIVTIPGYASGAVTFAIVAYNGTDWASTVSGASGSIATMPGSVVPWTEPGIAMGQNPAGLFTQNVPAITVGIPEPSFFDLLSLGVGSGLLACRRKTVCLKRV